MEKVAILGSGNVGVATAFYLAEKGVANITLIDIVEGKAKGSILDLGEASPIRGYEVDIDGTHEYKGLDGAKVVVITAGKVRKPNTEREELLEENKVVLEPICKEIKERAPDSIVIVATEPVATLTHYVYKMTGFDRFKVMGVAGKLDTTRVCEYAAEEVGVTPVEVSAIVLGGHHKFMVIPPEFIRVCGIPISELLPKEKVDRIISDTRNAGSTILSLLKNKTSMYSPGAAIAETVQAIVNNTRAIMCVPTNLSGEYGYEDICLGMPVQLGSNGIEKVIELELSLEVKDQLKASADVIGKTIESLNV